MTAYIQAAMRRARFEWLDDSHEWYGEIPELPGVWVTADNEEDCRVELREVLEGWIGLGLRHGHDLPPLDGLTIPALSGRLSDEAHPPSARFPVVSIWPTAGEMVVSVWPGAQRPTAAS